MVELLKPARERLKWVTLSACSSADANIQETLRWLGLKHHDKPPASDRPELTALARALVRELDCAVLAMRFRVEDDFVTDLAKQIYNGVLAKTIRWTEPSRSPFAKSERPRIRLYR